MKLTKHIKNEEGMSAILGVVALTGAMITLLSSFYIYQVNQSKYHAKVKESFQLINVMESLATSTRSAYDLGLSAVSTGMQQQAAGPAPCPNGGPMPVSPDGGVTYTCPCPDGNMPNLHAGSGFYYCGAADAELCVTREDSGEEYCTEGIFDPIAANIDNGKDNTVLYAQDQRPTWAKKWLNNLNDFYIDPSLKQNDIEVLASYREQRKMPLLVSWFMEQRMQSAYAAPTTGDGGELLPPGYQDGEGDDPVDASPGFVDHPDRTSQDFRPTTYVQCNPNNRDALIVNPQGEERVLTYQQPVVAGDGRITTPNVSNLCQRCAGADCIGLSPAITEDTSNNDIFSQSQEANPSRQNFYLLEPPTS